MNTVATTMMHTRVPKALRDEVKKSANELGISMSLIIEQALRNFAATKELFIHTPLVPTPYLEKILQEASDNKDNPEYHSGPFSNVDDAIEHLRSL